VKRCDCPLLRRNYASDLESTQISVQRSLRSGNEKSFVIDPDMCASCDRENGPVAKDALKTGDFNKIVIWVGEEQEEELKAKFKQTLAVYKKEDDARELATDYFMETAIRLHREAEGMPFTGLKPASPNPPDIAEAEKALETGDIGPLQLLLKEELEKETSKWFQKALEAKKNKDKSVESGRQWVDSYVKYIVFINKLYQKIQAGPPHGVGE